MRACGNSYRNALYPRVGIRDRIKFRDLMDREDETVCAAGDILDKLLRMDDVKGIKNKISAWIK